MCILIVDSNLNVPQFVRNTIRDSIKRAWNSCTLLRCQNDYFFLQPLSSLCVACDVCYVHVVLLWVSFSCVCFVSVGVSKSEKSFRGKRSNSSSTELLDDQVRGGGGEGRGGRGEGGRGEGVQVAGLCLTTYQLQ